MKMNKYLDLLMRTASLVSVVLLAACFGSNVDSKTDALSSDNSCAKLDSSRVLPLSNENCDVDFKNLGICGKLTPSEDPIPVMKAMTYKLKVWEKHSGAAQALDLTPNLKICARLWMFMPAESHGANPVRVLSSVTASGQVIQGEYDFKNVNFSMASDSTNAPNEYWEIQIKIKKGDGSSADEAAYVPNI
jgi:hypothetical protein